ncbi:MAG: CBS domain-containing protein [Nitrosopumilaceae archaeon]|uniref:CBS domain-containing protein n=2 Tax=Candidatus Nitrosomaritimum aestuariumsis TaxID=3342354 RepID=A0AC60WAH0_9ARCH|nr:CBS domain-containing protein [Nitrosopumilaceae archaeon]MBA4459644.1 CBS domain-containing protein [Nitrosopumilaceae archaeon]MBA4461140.1 CBS domain-containing protein [Nitrosopumilaceae archaeon]MBA4463819.1 CBS domain-containing protein [Nitrosopumilaceae archaeon]NCF22585.1 CBS domain-containing protein [Nitrosopumilaceae archaeon]
MLLKKAELNQIIIKKTITITPNTSLLEAREILLRHNLKRLVVINSKKCPVGIITEKDIAKTIYALGDKPIKSVKVSGFMSKKLFTVNQTASIYDCAKLMRRHRISSIIVLGKKGVLEGLVTKTDLASIFLTHAIAPLKVSKIMTRKVITAMPGDSLLYVESLLIHNRISRIVIERNKVPVGIITYRDFVPAKLPHWIAQYADPKEVENYRTKKDLSDFQVNQMSHLLHFKAVDIMASNPIVVKADEDVSVAVLLMIRNRISGLPVVKNSKLVGIVTKADIVKAIAKA